MSKAGVVMKSQWQPGDNPSRSWIPSRKQSRARRLMTTPLGSPVEPEVNIMGGQGIIHLGPGDGPCCRPVEGAQRTAEGGNRPAAVAVADHRRQARLTGDPLQPLHRKVRLKGHKGEAEPQAGQQAGHQIGAAGDEADPLPTASPCNRVAIWATRSLSAP